MHPRVKVVVGLYALLALLVWPVFPHFQSPNELTRWALAASLVERGSLEISSVLPLLDPGFEDLSVNDGRTYSNKAPGAALAALPGYLAARPFTGPPSAGSVRPSITAMRLFAATLPALLLALLLARAIARLGGETSRTPLAVAALLFATPLFAYGLLLFSHALVALCLFGAWAALFLPAPPGWRAAAELLAGALLGLAVVSEYPAAVPALVLLGGAAAERRPARVARLLLGAAPFALALGFYDRAAFGGVFELSSAHEKYGGFRSLAGRGLFGVGIPSPSTLLRLLLDPSKGLLVFSPFLLLVPRAFVSAYRVLPRAASVTLGLVPASLLVLLAGYPNWHGGWTVGARYLVPALPFLVLALGFREGGRLETALLGASALAAVTAALVFPFVPEGFPLPWGSFALPLLSKGLAAPNLFHLLVRPLALSVPFVLAAAAVLVGTGRRHVLSLVLGATLSCAAGLLANAAAERSRSLRLQRAYVEDVFFEQEGALERSLPAGTSAPGLHARREAERRLAPTAWPF